MVLCVCISVNDRMKKLFVLNTTLCPSFLWCCKLSTSAWWTLSFRSRRLQGPGWGSALTRGSNSRWNWATFRFWRYLHLPHWMFLPCGAGNNQICCLLFTVLPVARSFSSRVLVLHVMPWDLYQELFLEPKQSSGSAQGRCVHTSGLWPTSMMARVHFWWSQEVEKRLVLSLGWWWPLLQGQSWSLPGTAALWAGFWQFSPIWWSTLPVREAWPSPSHRSAQRAAWFPQCFTTWEETWSVYAFFFLRPEA